MNKRVVVIEDDTDILDIIKYILTGEGYDVIGFDHLEPLKKIISQLPSVVLLDIRLPDGTGDALCRAIKSHPASRHIPVILISAIPDLKEVAAQSQADGFLLKPFDVPDLVNLVKRFS